MAQKWNLQDIVPPNRPKRTSAPQRGEHIQQVPAREMRMSSPEVETPLAAKAPESRDSQRDPFGSYENAKKETYDHISSQGKDRRPSRIKTYVFLILGVLVIGGVGFFLTSLLSGAEITVTPKKQQTTVQGAFRALMQPEAGMLGYEVLTLEEEGEGQVKASGKEQVAEKATAEITVYNGFSSTPQKLVTNTRFEASGGIIFRVTNAVTIPGSTKGADGTTKPGSVKATVVADGSESSYNTATGKLTIPGLKGSNQYESMYGEIVSVKPGYTGTKFIIDEAELSAAQEKLRTELKAKLLARINSEKPNGFVVYESAATFKFSSLPSADGGEGNAVIKEKAELAIPIFNEAHFSTFIAQNTIKDYKGDSVRLESPQSLTFSYIGTTTEDVRSLASLDFELKGQTNVIWNFDAEGLKNELKGLPEADLARILETHESIDKAKAVIRPIWKRSFPKNPQDIVVTEGSVE